MGPAASFARLDETLIMDQANIVFPFIVNDKRGRVDEHFMETIQPLKAEFQYRQAKEQADTRAL
jgi:hypothetical protein